MRSFDALGLALLAPLALAACSRGCGEDLPDPDVCSGPRAGSVETAALGAADEDGFTPYRDGDVVRFVFTDGGEATLPIEFRLTGADVPPCVDHRTELRGCPVDEACADGLTSHVTLIAPLHTYAIEDEAGASETQTLFLRLDRANEPPDGARLRLESEIAGVDVSVELWLEVAGPDAAPAPAADAAP